MSVGVLIGVSSILQVASSASAASPSPSKCWERFSPRRIVSRVCPRVMKAQKDMEHLGSGRGPDRRDYYLLYPNKSCVICSNCPFVCRCHPSLAHTYDNTLGVYSLEPRTLSLEDLSGHPLIRLDRCLTGSNLVDLLRRMDERARGRFAFSLRSRLCPSSYPLDLILSSYIALWALSQTICHRNQV